MGATARTALLLPLAALAGCARLMGYRCGVTAVPSAVLRSFTAPIAASSASAM
jgi:hypothetical protein